MKEDAFIKKNKSKWAKLEEYNKIIQKKNISGLSKNEIRDFSELFKLTGYNLAYSRTHFRDSKTTQYLNQIVGISHNLFFTKEKSNISEIKSYFTELFPENVLKNKQYIYASFLAFLIGFVFSFVLILINTDNVSLFLPDTLFQNAGNSGAQSSSTWDYPLMSSFIMTNNIRVAFTAFVFGILFGVGTMYILFMNGTVLGGLTCYMLVTGQDMLSYASLILPHGIIELTAIFISGAAGLIIGWAMLVPGKYKRRDSTIKGAQEASRLLPGTVIMLIVAGIIEGFFTPLNISPLLKLAFSAITLIIIILYFNRLYKYLYAAIKQRLQYIKTFNS